MADHQSEPAGGVRLCFKSRGTYQKPVYVRLTSVSNVRVCISVSVSRICVNVGLLFQVLRYVSSQNSQEY